MSRYTPAQQHQIYEDCVQALWVVEEQMKSTEFLLQPEYEDGLLKKWSFLHSLKRGMDKLMRREEKSPNLLAEVIDVPSDSEPKGIAEIIDVE